MLNKNLRKLYLSENNLSVKCSESLKSCLQSNVTLHELYLSWNNFNSEAGSNIFTGLSENNSLKVLDLSYNILGKGKCKVSDSLQAFLIRDDTEIRHLDLSHNQIDFEESKVIASGLMENHTIYGFHYEGNTGNIDFQGNLIIDNEKKDEYFLKPKSYQING